MKSFLLYSFCLLSHCVIAASPAATQQWVRNFVATNTTAGGVSMDWVISYVATNAIQSAASYEQMRAQNAVSMAIVEASMSGLHALTFLHPFTSNTYTNVKMADANGGGWTNVVYGCGVSTNANHEAVLVIGELEYNCATFSNCTAQNDFTRIVGNVTNVVGVSYTPVSTNDWKTARGEN